MPRQRSGPAADAVTTSLTVLVILFSIRFAETLFHLRLGRYGIVPRTASGLLGILWSPLLHANLAHLMANALPLFILLILLLSNPRYRPYRTLGFVWVASGLGTWLIGRGHSVHIGASSVVFGLAAFLIVAGFKMRSWQSGAVAVFVFLAFGGIFYGVLPQPGPISWEGHLSGVVAGAWTAARTLRAG